MPSNEYDISRAFKRIENDLIDSMMKNLKRHQVEENGLGMTWEQWQAIQLHELEQYRIKNAKKFTGDFTEIDENIEDVLIATYANAQAKEERELLTKIKDRKFTPDKDKGGFFRLNEGKLQALITATKSDFTTAEYALLRQANDQYRQIIFDSMTYANITNDYGKATKMAVKDFADNQIKQDTQAYASQGLTYAEAVDKATHDFLKGGLRPIVYKNGARHSMSDYASMALRTGNKRAYLMGEGNAHDKYGLHIVRVNKRQDACPKCVGFLGKLLVDDVYGGGTRAEANAESIPTLSDAIQAGFLHPNCKDMYSVYIPGVSQPAKPWDADEIEQITEEYNLEQQIKYAQDTADTYNRMAKYSLDPNNVAKYEAKANEWTAKVNELTMPPAPPQPQPKVLTATGKSGKNMVMKGLTNTPTGKGYHWQMAFNPNLNDLAEQIKAVEQSGVPNTETLLKILYQNAINKADEDVLKLKASGAKLYEYGQIGKKKKAWEKKLNVLNLKDDISKLEADILDIEAHKTTALPADKTFSGIWKQDVKLSEFGQYEAKISGKIDYYIDKIDEWNTKGVSVYGHDQAYVDAKVNELTKHMQDVINYETEGKAYKNIADQFNTALKMKQDELDLAKDKLDDILNPKKKAKKSASAITEARRNSADFYYDIRDADNVYRDITSKAWLASTKSARESGYYYTLGSGAHNRPLRGYDRGWYASDFRGVGQIPLDHEGRKNVLDLADMIDKSAIPGDKWFARGLQDNYNNDAIVAFFGEDRDWLLNAPETELKQKLIGKVVTDEAYLSHGVVKSAGWSGHHFETFAPQGTKALYVEPFSHFAGHSYNPKTWDGIAKQTYSQFGESEILFQAMTDYEVLDIEVSGVGSSRRFSVKIQVVNQRSAKEIRDIWKDRMKKIGKTI